MLCVGLGITTFGSLYTTYDMQSVCVITATEEGVPLRSLSLDIRPRSEGVPVYRVHPSWKGSLTDHHFAALPAQQVDAQITAFILQDLYQQGYVEREKVEALASGKGPDLIRVLATSVFTVTKHAHMVIPFLMTQLPVTATLLSTYVVDLTTYDYGTYGFGRRSDPGSGVHGGDGAKRSGNPHDTLKEYDDLPLTGSYPFVGRCEEGYTSLFQQVSAYVKQWASITASRPDRSGNNSSDNNPSGNTPPSGTPPLDGAPVNY